MNAGDTDIQAVICTSGHIWSRGHPPTSTYTLTSLHTQTNTTWASRHTHGDTNPVGSCHLHNDLNSRSVEEASVSPHHHGWTLAVTQVNGGEDTLDEVVQIVPPGLKHVNLLPEAAGSGSLVGVGGCRDSQHLQRTVLHCFKMRIWPKAAAWRARAVI